MEHEDLLSPEFLAMSQEEQLQLIKQIRSDRHFTPPKKAEKKIREKKSKVEKLMAKMTPEQKAIILAQLRGDKE